MKEKLYVLMMALVLIGMIAGGFGIAVIAVKVGRLETKMDIWLAKTEGQQSMAAFLSANFTQGVILSIDPIAPRADILSADAEFIKPSPTATGEEK